MTHPHLYINLSLFLKWFIYIYYVYRRVLFLLAQANRMAHVSHFWNWVYYVFQEHAHAKNHTWKHAAKAIVKIVIIIINLFKIYYLLFLKYECKVNTFLSNNGIFCREISLQYVFLDMGQPLVFSLENDILLSDMLFLWQ